MCLRLLTSLLCLVSRIIRVIRVIKVIGVIWVIGFIRVITSLLCLVTRVIIRVIIYREKHEYVYLALQLKRFMIEKKILLMIVN